MKKFMSMMLGLSLILGAASVTFAQAPTPKKEEQKKEEKKDAKKKEDKK